MICPTCRSSNVSGLANIPQYNFCVRCQTAWRKKFEKSSYSKEYYSGASPLVSTVLQPIFQFFYFIRRLYVGLEQKNLWIDIGAGSGDFLKTVNARRKIGVEVSESAQKSIRSRGLETTSNKEFLNLNNLNADVISFWHVLEHLQLPDLYLKVARKNLSKNGKLLVAVPNIDSLEFRFFGKYWFHLAPKFHHWHFSVNSMKLLLANENFKVVLIDYFSVEHHLAGLLQSFINLTSRTEDILHKLSKRRIANDKIPISSFVWIIFWLTLGLPIILIFWLTAVLLKKPGTFVVVASRK